MNRLGLAPTKSNLLRTKERLQTALEGYDLLEQKREILIMELMRYVEAIKILEKDIDEQRSKTYTSIQEMFLAVGTARAKTLSDGISYNHEVSEKTVIVAGMRLPSLEIKIAEAQPEYSFLDTFAECDETTVEVFALVKMLSKLASLRSIVLRLAHEVKKTQRRVNALEKMVIPATKDTKIYIEGVLEERERESFFVQKLLKSRREAEL